MEGLIMCLMSGRQRVNVRAGGVPLIIIVALRMTSYNDNVFQMLQSQVSGFYKKDLEILRWAMTPVCLLSLHHTQHTYNTCDKIYQAFPLGFAYFK